MTQDETDDEMRGEIGAAALAILCKKPLAEISHEDIAQASGHDVNLIKELFIEVRHAIDHGLGDVDDKAFEALRNELGQDANTGLRDRILEAAIVRLEAHNPHKTAIAKLSKAAACDPALAIMLARRLNTASKTALEIAGVNTSGLKGILLVKGFSGVMLSCQKTWLDDEDDGLMVTIRTLDERLSQAENIAEMLKIIESKNTTKEAEE